MMLLLYEAVCDDIVLPLPHLPLRNFESSPGFYEFLRGHRTVISLQTKGMGYVARLFDESLMCAGPGTKSATNARLDPPIFVCIALRPVTSVALSRLCCSLWMHALLMMGTHSYTGLPLCTVTFRWMQGYVKTCRFLFDLCHCIPYWQKPFIFIKIRLNISTSSVILFK